MHKYLIALIVLLFPASSAFAGWTQWFDRDDPTATGDWETLADLLHEYPDSGLCEIPTGIECRETNGAPLSNAAENLTCETSTGLICKNADQPDGRCNDYKVRFLCEDLTSECDQLEHMQIVENWAPCEDTLHWRGEYSVIPVVSSATYTWTSDDGVFVPTTGTDVMFYLDPIPEPCTTAYYGMTVTAECGGKIYTASAKFKCKVPCPEDEVKK